MRHRTKLDAYGIINLESLPASRRKQTEKPVKTIIAAGGRGTRIRDLFPEIPKPLIPMEGPDGTVKPVLEWEICGLRDQGFTDIVLTVGYRAQQIMDCFGDGSRLGVSIAYWAEDTPLGNAGALIRHRAELGTEPFLLLNADAVFDVDFNRFAAFHRERNALVSLFTHPNSHPFDSSLVVADASKAVTAWLTKEDPRPEFYHNRVNAGLQVISPEAIDLAIARTGITPDRVGGEDENGKPIKVDLDRQVLKPLCATGRMFCYDSPEYCKDMGTPERYRQVSRDFRSGAVAAKNLSKPQKAIFLDRDGTINRYIGFLRKPEELELLPGAAEAIRRINDSGTLAIVVTNQPVIARGEVTAAQLDEIHRKLETLLGQEGAYIDALYYCPHHPDKGFAGEIPELKMDCPCRKPKPGLLLQAKKDFNIDLGASWMVGDGKNDVGAGRAAGCRTALITEEPADFGQDLTVGSLKEAVEKIFGR